MNSAYQNTVSPNQEVLARITRNHRIPRLAETLDGRARLHVWGDGELPEGCLVSVRVTKSVVGYRGTVYGESELTGIYGLI